MRLKVTKFEDSNNFDDNYFEIGEGNYGVKDYDIHVSGTGVNVKLGAIVRPFADNPFRVALAVETPTWYKLKRYSYFNLYDDNGMRTPDGDSYLKFKLRSPWKIRTGIGSTIGSTFAWDIDYEYAAYTGMSMSYPGDDYDNSGSYKDVSMNKLTRDLDVPRSSRSNKKAWIRPTGSSQ